MYIYYILIYVYILQTHILYCMIHKITVGLVYILSSFFLHLYTHDAIEKVLLLRIYCIKKKTEVMIKPYAE